MKQNRNGVAGIPRKRLEEKAEALANQGEWATFIDLLALLVFRTVLFPNVDGLVDLAVIDAFLAYHHSKESPIIAVLALFHDMMYKEIKVYVDDAATYPSTGVQAR